MKTRDPSSFVSTREKETREEKEPASSLRSSSLLMFCENKLVATHRPCSCSSYNLYLDEASYW